MLGTRGTCTLCPGTHLCACRQQEARSYHAMLERKQGKRLQELKNEGRQGGWIQGMERRVLGRSGCTMVLFLDQWQGFVILND